MIDPVIQYPKRLFITLIVGIFLVFLIRLIQLQVLYQDEYGRRSEENSIRTISREPIRGYVFDRNGKLVVDNRPSYTLTITPAEFDTHAIDFLAQALSVSSEYIRDRIRLGVRYNRFAPARIKRDIDFQTLSIIEENRERLAGIGYQVESKRYYPTGAKAPHLFGYTKEISERQLVRMGDEYRQGDMIGATGIEAAHENHLRGKKGFEFVTVNARGQIIGPYNGGRNDIFAQEGDDLLLTLDSDLQAFAESLLIGKHGAIVALDPRDGGVLALVSKPDFDPMLLSGGTPEHIWSALNNDPGKPLFNRATLTRYPPGSTLKMVLAVAALEEDVIPPTWSVNCTGGYRFGNRVFKDLHVHGHTGVIESIQRSCNVFYYTLMLKTGLERWNKYGREFGFGSATGLDIREENPGILPSEAYYNRVYGKGRWTQGYLVSLGIGQGEVGVSPIQMACYAMTLANQGNFFEPHVVRAIYSKQTGTELPLEHPMRKMEFKSSTWEMIRDGMNRAVNLPGGTGGAARVQGVVVSGKTGTAENPHGKDHAWFVGFAPFENPTIAICVLVENAGFGGAVAAPIAGLCIEKYTYRELIRHKPRPPVDAVSPPDQVRAN